MPFKFVADSFHTCVTAEALRAKIYRKSGGDGMEVLGIRVGTWKRYWRGRAAMQERVGMGVISVPVQVS